MFIESNFSETLSELMYEKNLTTDALGHAIGISGSTVRQWKSGKGKLCLTNALKLVSYFDCSLEYLWGRTDVRLNFEPIPCPPFHDSLMKVMKEEKLTQYQIINNTNYFNGHFWKWKKGADPSVETLIDLATYLNCTLDYLVGRER